METILCAAIHYDDGSKVVHQPKNIESGYVFCSWRHCGGYGLLSKFYDIENIYHNKITQGFLTSNNRYVEREEAYQIAVKAGQYKGNRKPKEDGVDILFSEDLY